MSHSAVTIEVKASLQWVFYRDERSRRWIAICDPLKVTVEADTHAELRENIEEGLNLLFQNLLRERELDRFLMLRGWSMSSQVPEGAGEVHFDVPIELVARAVNGSENRVH